MARHRWATGRQSPAPDRLDRVLNPNRAGVAPAGAEPGSGGDHAPDGYSDHLLHGVDPGTAPARAPSRRRWAATRRAALLAAGCALAVGGWQFVTTDRAPGEVIPIEPPVASQGGIPTDLSEKGPDSAGEADAPGQPASGEPDIHAGSVVVHVAGAVNTPGVIEAASGSRVFEVLEKAGGALPEAELSAINLAAVVQDGQQILIPRAGEQPPLAPDSTTGPVTGTALVNLNTADTAVLEELPGVGPVLAQRIAEWRTQHGPFVRPEDLDAVPGIGPAMLESLLPLVTV